jgi:DNA-binding beta-propeller fold protein YncE
MDSRSFAGAPFALAGDSSRERLYVGEMGSGRLLALDSTTLEIIDETVLAGLGYPSELALDVAGARLYVAHALSPKYGALSVVDTGTMTVIGQRSGNPDLPLTGSDWIGLDSRENVVYLQQTRGILILEASSLDVLGQVNVPVSSSLGAVTADRQSGSLYLSGLNGALWSWRPENVDNES